MRVRHYAPLRRFVKGGINTAIDHQRNALDQEGIEWTPRFRGQCDILHLNLVSPPSIAALVKARRNNVPVVVHTHVTGEDFQDSLRFSNMLAPVVDRYTQTVYDHADVLVAPSQYTKQLLQQKGVSPDIHVVSNGIDPGRLDGVAARPASDDFTVLNLGLVFERKGLSDFIAAGAAMPGTTFTWYGPRQSRLFRSRRTSKQITAAPSNVQFPGYIDDIRDAFADADVFFFPTYEENQGIALFEAAYCGLPLVIRDIPTYDTMFTHGENCLKADSVDGFVNQLQRLRDNPGLRERIGENARVLAEEHTLDTIGGELRAVYESVL